MNLDQGSSETRTNRHSLATKDDLVSICVSLLARMGDLSPTQARLLGRALRHRLPHEDTELRTVTAQLRRCDRSAVHARGRPRGVRLRPESLRDEREARGLTQAQLATRCGVSPRTISAAERGKPISRGLLKVLIETLGLSDEQACNLAS